MKKLIVFVAVLLMFSFSAFARDKREVGGGYIPPHGPAPARGGHEERPAPAQRGYEERAAPAQGGHEERAAPARLRTGSATGLGILRLPTFTPTANGWDTRPGGMTPAFTSTIPTSMGASRAASGAGMRSGLKAEAQGASGLAASTLTWQTLISAIATTGFGIGTRSCSMRTRTTMAGTWPIT